MVTDNRSLQVKDLEQEEQDHIVAKVCEQHCDPPYTLTTTNPHSLAKQYIQNIAIKINRMDNTANDESIMAIIQALLKAILKKYHPFKSLLQLHPSCLTLSQESRVTFQLQVKLELLEAMCKKAH